MAGFENIGKHRIYLDQIYFICYAGGRRELPEKDQREYNKIINLPFALQQKEKQKIPLEKNPNVVPLKGRQLLSFIKELNFVPFFDSNFENTRMLKLTDIIIFEAMRAKSYEMALQ